MGRGGVALKAKPLELAGGCASYDRCPVADKKLVCDRFQPMLVEAENDHFVACYRYAENGGGLHLKEPAF